MLYHKEANVMLGVDNQCHCRTRELVQEMVVYLSYYNFPLVLTLSAPMWPLYQCFYKM